MSRRPSLGDLGLQAKSSERISVDETYFIVCELRDALVSMAFTENVVSAHLLERLHT
jgi:hypothetical protein